MLWKEYKILRSSSGNEGKLGGGDEEDGEKKGKSPNLGGWGRRAYM